MLICCISCVKQNLSVSRRVIRKIQSSRILQCKQDSCYVFVTLVQCTVKSSFKSNLYLVIRCDINEQILPFVLSILPLGLEMFCQCLKCYQKHDLGFLFISKNWKLCILLMSDDCHSFLLLTIKNILNSTVQLQNSKVYYTNHELK